MVYSNDAWQNIFLYGILLMLLISGAVITVISFIAYRNARPKAAAVLAAAGYVCKLPAYVLCLAAFPDIIYKGNILMCLQLAVLIIAAAVYTVHMILFAVKEKNKNSEEQENEQGQE